MAVRIKSLRQIIIPLFCAFILCYCFLWFNKVHPLIVYDADDWTYISFLRDAVPMRKMWNPARIFPETFMAVPAALAVHFIFPVSHDYVGAICTAYALTAAVFISAYMWFFTVYLRDKLKLGNRAVLISAFFFLFHFSIFKHSGSNNFYMFWAYDVTCFFYYTISSILNGILIFCLARRSMEEWLRRPSVRAGILILSVYLALFSNLFSSVILVVYTGTDLLLRIVSKKHWLKNFFVSLRENVCSVIIILAWFVNLWFEAQGRRAESLVSTSTMRDCLREFRNWIYILNKPTVLFCVISVVVSLIIYLRKQSKSDTDKAFIRSLLTMIISCFLSGVYLVLLTFRTGSRYIPRADVVFSLPFFALVAACLCIAYIASNWKKSVLIIPLLFYVLTVNTFVGTHVFRENIAENLSPEKARAVDNCILEQVLSAAQQGLPETVVKVPLHSNSEDNWPHPAYLKERLPNTLRRHGLIDYNIKITIEVDPELNERFHLPR